MLYSLEYENEYVFASVLICCNAMQQLTAHVPRQIWLAKVESLLGLTPIMAIDKYRQTSSDIDKLRILSLACSFNTGSPVLNELGNGRIRCLCSKSLRRITMFADVNRFSTYAFMGLML